MAMVQSMTGYGKSVLQISTKKITIEVKSLNSKNLDLNVRTPYCYKEKELYIRKKIAKTLIRGKIDFSIYIELTSDENPNVINKEIVKNYITQLQQIQTPNSSNGIDFLKMAIKMPDALKTKQEDLDEQQWTNIDFHIDETLKKIVQYRRDEARSLETDFKCRITNIKAYLQQVTELDGDRIKNVKTRLQKALTDLKIKIDENRFEQELIYYLEKLDINEEKVRLENHLNYFLQELNSKDSNGKKLGFIVQEIGREINTTGSKANYAPMQKIVIQMKNELEKIKEQILNVL